MTIHEDMRNDHHMDDKVKNGGMDLISIGESAPLNNPNVQQ